MNSFKPEYIAQQALMFADMVKDCEDTGLPKVGMFTRCTHELFISSVVPCLQYKLYVSLGNCVVAADPPQKERLQLLNTVRHSPAPQWSLRISSPLGLEDSV